jgi:hypothetical protein
LNGLTKSSWAEVVKQQKIKQMNGEKRI